MILGITGHKGILGKSIINYIKKYEKSNYKISLYKNNVLDFEKLWKWIDKIDIILHLAAVTSIYEVNKNKKYAEQVNYLSVKFIVKKIKDINSNKKLIFISSSHVYSSSNKKISENSLINPSTYYGKLKYKSEKEIQRNLSNFIIIRLFSYYTPKQSKQFLIPALINKIKNIEGRKLKLKNYNNIRDISTIDYVTQQITNLIFKKFNGIVNCGSGNGISLESLAKKIAYNKFKKNIELDKRFKLKKPSKIICNNYKLLKITGIKKIDNLFKILWKKR